MHCKLGGVHDRRCDGLACDLHACYRGLKLLMLQHAVDHAVAVLVDTGGSPGETGGTSGSQCWPGRKRWYQHSIAEDGGLGESSEQPMMTLTERNIAVSTDMPLMLGRMFWTSNHSLPLHSIC